MLYQNHQDMRHAWEMSRASDPDRADHERLLRQCLDQMTTEIGKGQTVIITKTPPVNSQSITQQETALVIRTAEELELYRNMLGQTGDSLESAMSQAKLQKAMSEVNMNQSGSVIYPVGTKK